MPTVIGLDIGSQAFRAVELAKDSKKQIFNLQKALSCDFCPTDDLKTTGENLKHFISEASFSTKNACLAIPESQVFSTILNVPFQTEKEIKNYLEIQGTKIFPKPLDQLVYSFELLGPNEVNQTETDVNIVASGKEYVEQIFSLAKMAGLHVLAVESEAYAIVRSLMKGQQMNQNEGFLVVNIGHGDADMMVVKNGYVRFSRNITLGGSTFSKAIAQNLGISQDQAEKYRTSYGLDDSVLEGKVINAMKPVAETLISEVKRTIHYYTSRNAYVEFKKVIYSGSSAVMPGLMAYSAENLGMEVELANPFMGITFSPKLEKTKDQLINLGPVYTVAVGLALKEIF